MFVMTVFARLQVEHRRLESVMKSRGVLLVLVLMFVAGCDVLFNGPFRTPWHGQALASGTTIKVTRFDLVWGDDHSGGQTSFAIEYVTSNPDADAKRREAEVAEVFELVRPVSEQWGFREATVAAIPTLEHRGLYDLYWFQRRPDGHWASKVVVENGEWNTMSAPPR
jgi:hypothetical protein